MRFIVLLALLCVTACGPQHDQMNAVKAVAAEKVANGSMTQAEANLMVARERNRMANEENAASPQYLPPLGGNQPVPVVVQTSQPVRAPRPMVICNHFPGQTQCY